jgi:DNA-binding transcriptional LysR family regulator
MDKLRAYEVFCGTVETLSFSRAARRLGTSKAVVSKYVAALEAELGVRLLQRTTRDVSLTPAGRAFYERCRQLMEEITAMEDSARDERSAVSGSLRVSAPVAFGLLHLGPRLPAWLSLHPELALDLSLSDRFVRLVEEGFDLAIRIAGRLQDSTLIATAIATTQMLVCGAPAYLARAGRPRHPRDLARHACLAYASSAGSARPSWTFARGDRSTTVPIAPRLQVDNSILLRDALRAGFGLALMPSFVVADDLRAGSLVQVLPAYQVEPLTIHAVYPAARHLLHKTRAFVEFLRQAFADAPWSV